ncbi:hypothetical protein PFTANZ_00170, partial [Plasmodium falciparum Tanzania (2000708)]
LVTLETDISTDDIPTCVCEKSVADKVEKTCLKCGYSLGGAVPELGLLCGYGAYELVKAAIAAGIDFATKEGFKAGTEAGIQAAIEGVIDKFSLQTLGGKTLNAVITSKTYNQPMFLVDKLVHEYKVMCETTTINEETLMCSYKLMSRGKPIRVISGTAENVTNKAIQAAANETSRVTSSLTAQKTAEATSVSAIFSNPIVISFIVIVIKCGCALGGVAASVGIFGTVAVKELTKAATAAATELAKEAGAAAGKAAGDAELLAKFIQGLKALHIDKLRIGNLESLFTTTPYTGSSSAPILINNQYNTICAWKNTLEGNMCNNIADNLKLIPIPGQVGLLPKEAIAETLNGIVADAKKAAGEATEKAIEEVIQRSTAAVESTYASCQSAIIASVVAIL